MALGLSPDFPRLKAVTGSVRIQVPHAGDVCVVVDDQGARWTRKSALTAGDNTIAAEVVCWGLGDLLEVSQPEAAIMQDEDGTGWSWMTKYIVPPTHWCREYAHRIANLEQLGAMVVLDAITCNEDRHQGNLIVQHIGDGALVKIWAIDSGNARLGYESDFSALELGVPIPRGHAKGLPLEQMRVGLLKAITTAESLSASTIRRIVARTNPLDFYRSPDAVSQAVWRRCQAARPIALAYFEKLLEAERA